MRREFVLLLALASAGCGPSPTRVCKHVIEIASAEVASDERRALNVESCAARIEAERSRIGVSVYRTQARCVMAADSTSAISDCDEGLVRRTEVTEPDS